MNINDDKLTNLCNELAVILRRKIVDIDTSTLDDIKFIDPFNYSNDLTLKVNNLVLGKRGSGKTTLFLSSIKQLSDSIIVTKDCQNFRNIKKSEILIIVLLEIFKIINIEIEQFDRKNRTTKKFNNNYKGIKGVYKFLTFSRDKSSENDYVKLYCIKESVVNLITLLNKLREIPDHLEYKISEKANNKKEESIKFKSKIDLNNSLNLEIPKYYSSISGKVNLANQISFETSSKKSHDVQRTTETAYVEVFDKYSLLEQLKCDLTEIINDFHSINKKSIICYLDDFYYVKIEDQPFIIQYFLDSSKLVKQKGLCFKISSIPNRIKINENSQVDFSFLHDAPTIKLDRDLSDMLNLRNHLISIISAIAIDYQISQDDIVSLFNNEEIITRTIIATGGIPRDFIMAFTKLVKLSRADFADTIKMEHLYSFVSDLKDDKVNNIEADTDIDPEKIRDTISIIQNELIDKLKTNVILYPMDKAKEHEVLLKNMANLRYIHLIAENISSEKVKNKTFTAYLIDMTFYTASKRLRQNFDFVPFWERDSSSRLNKLRNAKIWHLEMKDDKL